MTLKLALLLHQLCPCCWWLRREVFRRLRPEDMGMHREALG